MTHPDGTAVNVQYQYCGTGGDTTCTGLQVFSVDTQTVGGTGGTTQIAPSTRVYYDGLSRAVMSDIQGFDWRTGHWIQTDTVYDAYGRVAAKDRPYFQDDYAPQPGGLCASGTNVYCATFVYECPWPGADGHGAGRWRNDLWLSRQHRDRDQRQQPDDHDGEERSGPERDSKRCV